MADKNTDEKLVEKSPIKKRKLITKFLKWSAPSMDRKSEVHDRNRDQQNTERPVLLGNKCGELREVLDCIRPPRSWSEDGVSWRQEVSDEPATRAEVLALRESLEEALAKSNARETGICEVREIIYADLFDELIRQVTINCIERGLILLRLRNEAEESLRTYRRLNVSSLAYGVKKTLEADKVTAVLKEEVNKLDKEKESLKQELKNIMFTIATRERELAEKMEEIQTKHKHQQEFLKEIQATRKELLLSITSLNKNNT